jgi:hypothetical protein
MATPTVQTFKQTAGSQARHAQTHIMAGKGTSDDNIYPVSINPVTGAILTSGSGVLDFGDAATAERVAAMLGAEDKNGAFNGLLMSTDRNLPEQWKGLTVSYPTTTQETYAYFYDAAKTSAICTITIDYSDASKAEITSITRA